MNSATIPILEKTVSILEAITASKHGISAKNLSISLEVAPASCYRILRTLSKHNWIRDVGDGQYTLAFGLASLTRAYADVEHFLRLLEPSMQALSDETGLSTKISLREGDYAVTAIRAESRRPNVITSPVGSKIHLSLAGAAGAVLLGGLSKAESDDILERTPKANWEKYSRAAFQRDVASAKSRGVSVTLGKFHPSIYAMAVPIKFSPENTGALAVVGWPDDFNGTKKIAIEKLARKRVRLMQQIIDNK